MLSIKEAAARLGVAVVTVRRLVKRGELSHYRVGKLIKITAADLTAYLARQRGGEGTQYGRCIAMTGSGGVCGRPATTLDPGGGGPVCDYHAQFEDITPDELVAVRRGIEDIKQGRYVTLEEYRSGKRP